MKKILCILIFGVLLVGCGDGEKSADSSQDVINDIAQSVQNIAQNVSGEASSIAQNIQDKTEDIAKNVSENINKTMESFSQKTDEIIENVHQKTDEVIKIVDEKKDEIAASTKEIADASVAAIKETSEKVSQKVVETKEKTEEKITTTVNLDAGKKTYGKCIACHGRNAEKLPPGGNEIIKDWEAEKIKEALVGYRAGTYGFKTKVTMTTLVKNMSDEEFTNVSYYIESLNK